MADPDEKLDGWRDLPDLEALKSDIKGLEKNGMLLRVYDAAINGLVHHPRNLWLRHRAVLALARSGATETATREYKKFSPEEKKDGEVAALGARLEKDLVWQAKGAKRKSLAAKAAKSYAKIYRVSEPEKAYFPGINAATMRLVAGDIAGAGALAKTLLKKIDGLPAHPADDPDHHENYYRAATEAEALAILGDAPGAHDALLRAKEFLPEDYSAHETTRSQIGRICDIRKLNRKLLAPLIAPRVIHYCGHMIEPPGKDGRFVAEGEEKIAADIRKYLDDNNVGFAFGSLACGADILFAEAMIRRKGEIHIVLPFRDAEFVKESVRDGGTKWVRRFNRCRKAAASVTYATEDSYLGENSLFGYCSQLAMGLAVLRARYLDTNIEQVALWDGKETGGEAGTSADIAIWRGLNLPQTILNSPARGVKKTTARRRGDVDKLRVNRAMLFGDIKGFSKLGDRQVPVFVEHILGAMAKVLKRYGDEVEFQNTWGDGIFVVFRDVKQAARCALDLQAALSRLSLKKLKLPGDFSLRLGGHFGPAFECFDPILGKTNFFGAQTRSNARKPTHSLSIERNIPLSNRSHMKKPFTQAGGQTALLATAPNAAICTSSTACAIFSL